MNYDNFLEMVTTLKIPENISEGILRIISSDFSIGTDNPDIEEWFKLCNMIYSLDLTDYMYIRNKISGIYLYPNFLTMLS